MHVLVFVGLSCLCWRYHLCVCVYSVTQSILNIPWWCVNKFATHQRGSLTCTSCIVEKPQTRHTHTHTHTHLRISRIFLLLSSSPHQTHVCTMRRTSKIHRTNELKNKTVFLCGAAAAHIIALDQQNKFFMKWYSIMIESEHEGMNRHRPINSHACPVVIAVVVVRWCFAIIVVLFAFRCVCSICCCRWDSVFVVNALGLKRHRLPVPAWCLYTIVLNNALANKKKYSCEISWWKERR